MMINYNEIYHSDNEINYIQQAIEGKHLSGNNVYSQKVCRLIEERYGINRCMLLPSCTAALEMITLLINIDRGDEVIMPSYTFVSTANAFALRGATIKFVDLDPQTMNVSLSAIKEAITDKTKAIVVVNYGGCSVDFDQLRTLIKDDEIYLIEDNAQGIEAKYKDQYLGSLGDLSCISFHETKNVTAGGEGGALLINDPQLIDRAEVIQEKGTDRRAFEQGLVNKYTWKRLGSSYLMAEINAAFLLSQLEAIDTITSYRVNLWHHYYQGLQTLATKGFIERQEIPDFSTINGHLFFIKLKDHQTLQDLSSFLRQQGIQAVTHYVPLHRSTAGKRYGIFVGCDEYTTQESQRLLRLPLHCQMDLAAVEEVINKIYDYFEV